MGREAGNNLNHETAKTYGSFKERLAGWLGLGEQSESVKNYVVNSNTQAVVYMAPVVFFINVITIVKQILDYLNGGREAGADIVPQILLFVAVSLACILSMAYARRDLLRKKSNSLAQLSYTTIILFSIVCLVFGLFTSLFEYNNSGIIMTFISMELIVICMLAWRPFISISMVVGTFVILYLAMLIGSDRRPELDFIIGYVIAGVSIIVTGISSYSQKKMEAEKDESLVSTYKHIEETALMDDLTGAANMSFFIRRASEILQDKETHYLRQMFIYLDVENFSPINEKYGFEAGNAFIRKFAGQVIDEFYDGLVGRQGDDHFVILCDKEDLEKRLANLRSYIYEFEFDTQTGLKAGGYKVTSRDENPSIACDRARYACNTIKKHFDQDYCEYDAVLDQQFQMRQYIVNNVDAAIDRGDIKVYYQPVCWAKNRKLCGYEALSKWEDKSVYAQNGFLPTPKFIPVLEEYRQVHKIDMVVVDTVCRDLRWLMDNNRPAVPVSLNFSRLDFELTDVVDLLVSCTSAYNIPHDMIHVEVTESALSDKLESLHKDLDRLKALGFPLWLDDFGSGYSSLNVLKDFEFDVIKIDMVFLSSFYEQEKKSKAVIKNVVSMAKDLGMSTLTEGVETLDEAEYLRNVGCDRLQGYLFGKPMPLKEILVKLKAGTLPVSEEYDI
ncbi:MAG: EAL domain-containing protein [Clostridiales bacterium]|nr:EAL domain-containing protein [Clostridiales bacterium]